MKKEVRSAGLFSMTALHLEFINTSSVVSRVSELICQICTNYPGSGIMRFHLNPTQECIIEENGTFLNNGKLSLLDQEVHSGQRAKLIPEWQAGGGQEGGQQQQRGEGNNKML